jgi:hypothetical protein
MSSLGLVSVVTTTQDSAQAIGIWLHEIGGGPEAPPQAIQVTLDISPPTINPKVDQTLRVAPLSSPDFEATVRIDRTSVTFGHTGEEASLESCDTAAMDVNHDGLPDLVCEFDSQRAAFQSGDQVAILKAATVDGTPVIGVTAIRTVPSP